MSDKEKLAEAMKLLESLYDPSAMNGQDGQIIDSTDLNNIHKFLNPEPEIDWDEVPIGTRIINKKGNSCHYTGAAEGYTTFTIPPQASHIHKCPWPEDRKKPDWVKDADIIWCRDKGGYTYGPYPARQITWGTDSKWFAVLKLTTYRKDLI